MKMKWTLLLIAGLATLAPAMAQAQASDLQPMVVQNVTGNLHVRQSTPFSCSGVEGDVPVIGGRFDISPSEGRDVGGGNRLFVLTQGTVIINPFTMSVSCPGSTTTQDYSALSVQVAQTVSFVGTPYGGPDTFAFSIPPEDVLLYEAGIANGAPENGDSHPSEPVTGTIDLAAGTVQMHVVVATNIHVDPLGDFGGAFTADLSGTIALADADGDGVPDRTDNCRLVPNSDQTPVPTPVIVGPPDITFGSCLSTAIGSPTATDVCDATPVTVTNNAPSFFPLGTTVVTWTGVDGHSRTATRDQNVTVVDTTPPVITSVPANITLTNCGPAGLGSPTATDDCGGTPTFTNNAPPRFPAGATIVTWTATDASGNHATATQTVTVTDTVPPVVSCVAVEEPDERHDRHDRDHDDDDDGFFRVATTDACTASPTLRLGSYVLANNETIQISQTRRPGVRLVDLIGRRHIKHFQVGPGQALITSTDASGNVGSDRCLIPHEEHHDRR